MSSICVTNPGLAGTQDWTGRARVTQPVFSSHQFWIVGTLLRPHYTLAAGSTTDLLYNLLKETLGVITSNEGQVLVRSYLVEERHELLSIR
jgi:hypothetical protein